MDGIIFGLKRLNDYAVSKLEQLGIRARLLIENHPLATRLGGGLVGLVLVIGVISSVAGADNGTNNDSVINPPSSQGPPSKAPNIHPPTDGSDDLSPVSSAAYQVISVIDGDTIKVSQNGTVMTVRLIGLDTPETKDPRKPVECFGRESTSKMKELVEGKRVTLVSDPTQGDLDKYKRSLRYVMLETGQDVALKMIQAGFGHEYTYDLPYAKQAAYKDAQRIAQLEGAGLWATDACRELRQPTTPASPTPAPSPAPMQPDVGSQSGCDPNYVPCVPVSASDLDCSDINGPVSVIGADIHRFDRDSDGLGCE